MDIKFKTLTMRNFLSYGGKTTLINLDRGGTTLITGEDLDNVSSGVGGNGTGKTVIVNALVYALYDKPLSNISKDNLVNNINKKNMEVTLDFDTNNKHYHIQRVRKEKVGAAGNWVKLSENGKDITPDNVTHTNELIEEIIGIPYDLFIRIVAISANHIPFLDLKVRHPSEPNQTDIIEELFNLKTLSINAVILKKEINATDASIKFNKARIEQLEKEHERHATQITSAELRVVNWVKSNRDEIKTIETKLKAVENVDIDNQREFINSFEMKSNERIGVAQQHKDLKRELNKIDNNKNDFEKELVHLVDEKCPYCLRELKDAKERIVNCKKQIHTTDKTIKTLMVELDSITATLGILDVEIKELDEQITVSNIEELINISGKTSSLEKEVENLKTATNPFIEPLEELQNLELDPIDLETINELTELSVHQKFLWKLLTKKDSFVRKALLNKNIPFLNSKLTQYLKDLGLPHTVEFTHEMTAQISQFGRTMEFGNLSNGQRARVNLALAFAFKDVLENIHGRINVCMLDEFLDVGLDATGQQAAAKMLKQKSRNENISLYIISHITEFESVFDQQLVVQLSKGFSYINEETT